MCVCVKARVVYEAKTLYQRPGALRVFEVDFSGQAGLTFLRVSLLWLMFQNRGFSDWSFALLAFQEALCNLV